MSLHQSPLYERFPVYDESGMMVGYGVRLATVPGVTIIPLNVLNAVSTVDDIRKHVELADLARYD